MSEWPKRTTMYLHSDKESNWDKGKDIGLSEDAIGQNFKYCLYEIEVVIETVTGYRLQVTSSQVASCPVSMPK